MKDLMTKLEELKYSLKFPKLHLTNHFDEIINNIDIAAENGIKYATSGDLINLINDQRNEMISKLRCVVNILTSSCGLQSALIKKLELSAETIDANFTKQNADIESFLEDLHFQFEAAVMQKQCFVFLEKDLFETGNFGTLIFVKDEYIGRRGVQYLRKILQDKPEKIVNSFNTEYLNAFCLRDLIENSLEFLLELSLNNSCRKRLKFYKPTLIHDTSPKNLWLKYKLGSIKPGTFRMLTSLEEIDLSNQELESLDIDLFKGLTNLKKINLSVNGISKLSPYFFQGLTCLESINLGSNQLEKVDESLFQNLPHLTTISLSNNQLKNCGNIFANCVELKAIILSDNLFTALDTPLFSNLPALKIIDFKNNRLNYMAPDVFANSMNIEILDLSNNHLDTLDENVLFNCPNLKLINVRRNKLSMLSNRIFSKCTSLEKIDLSENLLETVDGLFDGLKELKLLYLNDNKLTFIGLDQFRDNQLLDRVSLVNNPLEAFDPNDLHGMSKGVEVLYM